MPYTAPATVVTATTITTAWGNSVKAATDYLANPPACRVRHSANQSIATATDVILAFNTELFDTDVMHDTVTNNSRITLKTAGLYVVMASATFDVSAVGHRTLTLQKNGATPIAETEVAPNPTAARGTGVVVSTIYKFAVNDYVEVRARQASGAGLNVLALGEYSPIFQAVWVGLG